MSKVGKGLESKSDGERSTTPSGTPKSSNLMATGTTKSLRSGTSIQAMPLSPSLTVMRPFLAENPLPSNFSSSMPPERTVFLLLSPHGEMSSGTTSSLHLSILLITVSIPSTPTSMLKLEQTLFNSTELPLVTPMVSPLITWSFLPSTTTGRTSSSMVVSIAPQLDQATVSSMEVSPTGVLLKLKLVFATAYTTATGLPLQDNVLNLTLITTKDTLRP